MVLPALAASLGALYGVGKSVDSIRYWNDYYRNTGKRPKYPFRSGSMDSFGYSAGSLYSVSRFYRRPRRYITNRNHYHYHYHYR